MLVTIAPAHFKRLVFYACSFVLFVTIVSPLGAAVERASLQSATPDHETDQQLVVCLRSVESFLPSVNEPLVPAMVSAPLRSWVQASFCSGGEIVKHTWHLSVINGGQPRGTRINTHLASTLSQDGNTEPVAWPQGPLDQACWTIRPFMDRNQQRSTTFGVSHAMPVRGDFNGDGLDEMGLFVDGQWFIDLNANGRWDEQDLWVRLGQAGDYPVTGDWDGDGKTDIGVFGRSRSGDVQAIAAEPGLPDADNRLTGVVKNASATAYRTVGWRTLQRTFTGEPRTDGIDHVFQFGVGSDIPVTGDWNGDGIDNIGIFRRGRWVLDTNGDGRFDAGDVTFDFGAEQDLPVVGDWNGDGVTDVGVYRRGVWHLDANGDRAFDQGDRQIQFGGENDLPVAGDFNGEGADQLGVYSPTPAVTQRP